MDDPMMANYEMALLMRAEEYILELRDTDNKGNDMSKNINDVARNYRENLYRKWTGNMCQEQAVDIEEGVILGHSYAIESASEENEKLKQENNNLRHALRQLNQDLSDEEHVDSGWIESVIERSCSFDYVRDIKHRKELADKDKMIEELKEALEFYASSSSWNPEGQLKDWDDLSGVYICDSGPFKVNGRRARAVLKKIKG